MSHWEARNFQLAFWFSFKTKKKWSEKWMLESWFQILTMAAKLEVVIACLVVLFSKSGLCHSPKPLTCGDYRVLGHQSVFQLDNYSKWPCQIFFNVNDKCRPRLLCSKFVLDKKKKNGICDFVVNQLSPDGNNGIQKKVCNALFFQGNT